MKKITPPNISIENIDELIQSTIKSLYADSIVKKRIDALTMNEKEVQDHLATMLSFQKDQHDIETCITNNRCIKNGAHYIVDVERDAYGRIQRVIKPCPIVEKKLKVSQFLIYEDFPESLKDLQLFDDIEKRVGRKDLVRYLIKVFNGQETNGLYLLGPHNTGKSFSLATFAYKYASNELGSIGFIDIHEFIQKLVYTKQNDEQRFQRDLEKLIQLDILILDALGSKDLDDQGRDLVLIPLLNERLKLNKITMMTSIFPIRELEVVFRKYPSSVPRLKELTSLIQASMKVIELPASYSL
jgi:DNA replication protein DnaC